ncbi:hypothetical protein MFIFM68171_05855 [Madurella fahalii]|uniref:Uncharacterized protein n=1 Tax=Madurella fahalii TaxID=1157608 RepID=A0ABQ0GDM5_9PEZI
MRTYPTPHRVCELCMDPLGRDQTMDTAGYYPEDPEFETINAASGNARVARCGSCRMLTTRIHGFRHASDPHAARDALANHIPREIAAVERKFAHARRWNPDFRAVPSHIHTAALERMRVNVLREVEGRLRESRELLGESAAASGQAGAGAARTPDSDAETLLLGERAWMGSNGTSASASTTDTSVSGGYVGPRARLRWLLGQDAESESGEGSSSGQRSVARMQMDERFTDVRQIQFGDMPIGGIARARDAGDDDLLDQLNSPDRRLNTTPVEPSDNDADNIGFIGHYPLQRP